VIRALQECEQRFRVTEWTLQDFWVWPLYRIKVELAMLGGQTGTSSADPERTRFQRVSQAAQTLTGSVRAAAHLLAARLAEPFSSPSYVLGLSTGPYTQFGKLKFDNNLGPVAEWLEELRVSTQVLTWSESTDEHVLSTQKIGHILRDLGCLAVVLAKLHRVPSWPDFERVLDYLESAGISRAALPSVQWLHQQAWRTQVTSWYYGELMRRHLPVGTILVSYYDDYCFGLTLASWRRKVPAVDLTHGLQGNAHGAYCAWRLPSDKVCSLLPQSYLCWTECDADLINHWYGAERADSVGSPLLTAWQESPRVGKLELELPDRGDRPNVLVTLWPLQSGEESYFQLILSLAQNTPQLNWWFRLHPRQIKDEKVFQWLEPAQIDRKVVRTVSHAPLPAILQASDILITRYSATVLEAKLLGLPAIVIDRSAPNLFAHYMTADTPIYFADTFEAALARLNALSARQLSTGFAPISRERRREILKKHFGLNPRPSSD